MIQRTPKLPSDAIADFCRRHLIVRLSLFGSALREDFRAESDVDVLVEFSSEAEPSLLDLGAMQQELCDLLGRQVDLKTREFLSPTVRDHVEREARVQYAA